MIRIQLKIQWSGSSLRTSIISVPSGFIQLRDLDTGILNEKIHFKKKNQDALSYCIGKKNGRVRAYQGGEIFKKNSLIFRDRPYKYIISYLI